MVFRDRFYRSKPIACSRPHTNDRKATTALLVLSFACCFASANLNSARLSCLFGHYCGSSSALLSYHTPGRQNRILSSFTPVLEPQFEFQWRAVAKMSGTITPVESAETPTFCPSADEQTVISQVLSRYSSHRSSPYTIPNGPHRVKFSDR